jgi:hypothetical protein
LKAQRPSNRTSSDAPGDVFSHGVCDALVSASGDLRRGVSKPLPVPEEAPLNDALPNDASPRASPEASHTPSAILNFKLEDKFITSGLT